MNAELANVWLFAMAIAKTSLLTGLGPAVLMASTLKAAGARFQSPVAKGKRYRVEGHYLGDFICEILYFDRDLARLTVIDPLRPQPRVKNRCCFPECVREDFHGGDHEFQRVRKGVVLEIHWRTAKWIPIDKQVSGGLAVSRKGLGPSPEPGNKPVPENSEVRMTMDVVNRAEKRYRKIMRAYGISRVEWLHNRGKIAVWRVTFCDAEQLTVELPHFGTTESTVLRKVIEQVSASRKVRFA